METNVDIYAVNLYHAGLFQVDIFTEVCTLRWLSQTPMMLEQCFNFLNTFICSLINLTVPQHAKGQEKKDTSCRRPSDEAKSGLSVWCNEWYCGGWKNSLIFPISQVLLKWYSHVFFAKGSPFDHFGDTYESWILMEWTSPNIKFDEL